MKMFVKNIGSLVGVYETAPTLRKGAELGLVPIIYDAWLAIEDGVFVDYGKMSDWPGISDWRDLEVLDVEGAWLMPTFCDSHTHLVFAASRSQEFSDRIKGMSYEEIAARGGGILNSADKLAQASEEQLYNDAMGRLDELVKLGTGAIEIKSGYGLSVEAELKMLRVIRRIKESHSVSVKSTFLGAHAYPAIYKEDQHSYVNLICDEMIPAIVKEGLADFIDVFCEANYFGLEETERILAKGAEYGLVSKVHVNQFNSIGGIALCSKMKSLTVDHLEVMSEEDFEVLRNSELISVALPGCSLFIRIPYTPARRIIDEGNAFALASDFNPGSSPSGNMQLVMSLACINMGMTPEEAFNAATINGAYAMGVEDQLGSITPGKQANFMISSKVKELADLPYYFGHNSIDSVYLKGKKVV